MHQVLAKDGKVVPHVVLGTQAFPKHSGPLSLRLSEHWLLLGSNEGTTMGKLKNKKTKAKTAPGYGGKESSL